MSQNFAGSTVLVTGATSGIGRAAAREQAEAALFLLSDAAAYMTGAVMVVDGGSSAGCKGRRLRSTGRRLPRTAGGACA